MHVAIVGATGAVGVEMLSILEERAFPTDRVSLWASARSAGKQLTYRQEKLVVRELNPAQMQDVDIALFSAGSSITKAVAGQFRNGRTVIIDNSSAFRMDPHTPLVVPEINPQDISTHQGLIANPNCTTIIMAMAVWPIHRNNPVQRLLISTYQAVSGAGASAMQELLDQTRQYLNTGANTSEPRVLTRAELQSQPNVFPHPCAFNLFSHNTAIDESGYNQEERKVADETRKIFHTPQLPLSATCIRVPILRAHSESITLTTERPITPDQVRTLLQQAPGVRLVDDPQRNYFPMPIDASGGDDVLVGRIRQDLSDPTGCSISLFVCGDQLRKGAALNAVQIAELLSNR
ncbi:MAG: Aspartate-semialdehyde dehydrogenase [Phycisphaerae bacterium]|nr:Aspartate-semialdehyde dehydrogenase [Phycisphaerae bacterium]